jgi:hypothetical protein
MDRRSEVNETKNHGRRRVDMSMELESKNGNGNDKDTLYMLGGVALVVFGAGLILSNPFVRRYMSRIGMGNLAHTVMPDIERYLNLRAM